MVSKKDQKLLKEALQRFKRDEEADRDERRLALEDLKFVFDEDGQWSEDDRAKRQGRPCYTFDRVSGALDQIVGDQLQNRPAIKVRPSEDGDAEIADIRTGLIRHIESNSNAKRAYNTAFKFSAAGGYGVWRVSHDYANEEAFEQNIVIDEVDNPFCVLFDAHAQQPTKHDGTHQFYFDDMPKEEFEAEYPKASASQSDFDHIGENKEWLTKDTVRVADYYRKVKKEKTLLLLNDGRVIDEEDSLEELEELAALGIKVVNKRKVDGYEIEHYRITGAEVLEKLPFVGKYFPYVPVYGKSINIEGKKKYRGVVRKAKDSQRLYNYEMNSFVELTELQPKQPYLVTQKMIEGHEDKWSALNVSNDPALVYNIDQGLAPKREAPPQVSQAQLMALNIAADNVKAQTGIFDASMGAQSNETSGRAIRERDRQGDTATYEFTDELSQSLEHTGRIINDLIPKIYDTKRQIRILGEDEAEKVIEINKPVQDGATGEWITINDLSQGTYDITVSTGASYSTKRTETAEQLGAIMAQNPQLGQLFADVYVKSLDLVGADDVVDRIRMMMIKQGIIEPNEEEMEQVQKMQQQNQAQQQMQQAAMQAEQRAKAAETAKDEADARYKDSQTLLNQIEAKADQLELAVKQQDLQAQAMTLQAMRGLLGNTSRLTV